MICRVFYKLDGSVSIVHPAPKARLEEESDTDFLDRVSIKAIKGTELEGLLYDDLDSATLPNRKDREKWRGSSGQGIHIDSTIKTEAEKRLEIDNELDTELSKPSPDSIKILKLQRKLDKKVY